MSRIISGARSFYKLNTALLPEYRRLDTVARFLEHGQVCTAVAYSEGKLFISSNKLRFGQDDFSSKEARGLKKALDLLRVKKSDPEKDHDYFYNIYKTLVSANLKVNLSGEKLINTWLTHIKENDPENYSDAQDAIDIFRLNKAANGKKLKKAIDFLVDLMKAEKSFTEISVIKYNLDLAHNGALKDAKKLIELVRSEKFEVIRDCILDLNNVVIIYPPTPESVYIDPKGIERTRDHHAEMNLAHFIIKHKIAKQIYLGISKLSCYDCSADLEKIKKSFDVIFMVRGSHGYKFESRMVTEWEPLNLSESIEPKNSDDNQFLLRAYPSDSEAEDHEIEALGVVP